MKMVKNFLFGLILLVIGFGSGQAYQAAVRWFDHENAVKPLDRTALGIGSEPRIVMLSLSTCPVCRNAREWLAANHIEHAEWVIDESDSAQKMAGVLKVTAVPVFLIGDRQVTGFNPTDLLPMLKADAGESLARLSPQAR